MQTTWCPSMSNIDTPNFRRYLRGGGDMIAPIKIKHPLYSTYTLGMWGIIRPDAGSVTRKIRQPRCLANPLSCHSLATCLDRQKEIGVKCWGKGLPGKNVPARLGFQPYRWHWIIDPLEPYEDGDELWIWNMYRIFRILLQYIKNNMRQLLIMEEHLHIICIPHREHLGCYGKGCGYAFITSPCCTLLHQQSNRILG